MSRFYRIQTGLFRKYLFSLDDKIIGLQYALTSLIFLLIGFALAMVPLQIGRPTWRSRA